MTHADVKKELLKNPDLAKLYATEDLAYELGRKVKRIRFKNGLTQKELANLLGTKQSSIARLENGSAGLPSLSFLQKIADVTGYYLLTPEFISYEQKPLIMKIMAENLA